MRHRLFYVFPDVQSARQTLDDLLLARIEERHIRYLSAGPLPNDMPTASVLQSTDLVNGAEHGMAVGVALGLALGGFIIWYFGLDTTAAQATALALAGLVGLVFGGWAASLAAAALPNTRLKAFTSDLEQGKILLIVDVPARRVSEIERLLAERHPETRFGGEDSRIPVFP